MKNVIITGAAGNLGKVIVESFIGWGANVIALISYRNPSPFKPSPGLETFPCDLTNESETQDLIAKIIIQYKQIDAAFLLAGGFAAGGVQETDATALHKMITLNFETAWFVAKPVFLQMQKQATGGRIVLVGSRPSLVASDGRKMMSYALSKSLLFRLAEYLNAEGSSKNVITSVIVPSVIDTPDNRMAMPKADFSKWVSPEQISSTLAFITSADGDALREPVFKIYGDS